MGIMMCFSGGSKMNAKCLISLLVILSALTTAFSPGAVLACTTFHMTGNGSAMGKSYDWNIDYGLVVINKRGIAKQALNFQQDETALTWTSRYASVTFNQYGVEMPNGGLNESGLMVELMWLNQTEYPQTDGRPVVNELQWIQWALDNHSTVAELTNAADSIRIVPIYADLHYMACDASDQCATFEYLDGELVVHIGDGMLVNTLANHTYTSSLEYLEQFEGFGGDQPLPTSTGSLDRFVRASTLALADQTEELPDAAFSILDSVSQGRFTVWNIVYMPDESRVYFRTQDETGIKSVDLTSFDLDCTTETMILDIEPGQSGDVSSLFEAYTEQANRALLNQSFASILAFLPAGTIDALAAFPDAQECTLTSGDDDPLDDTSSSGCNSSNAPGTSSGFLSVLLLLSVHLWLLRRRRSSNH